MCDFGQIPGGLDAGRRPALFRVTMLRGLSCAGAVLLTSKKVRNTWCTSHLPVPGDLRPDRWIDPEASFGTVMTAS